MQVFRRHILALLLLISAWPSSAQNKPEAELPHVLIIGDSIYAQNARGVGNELKDQARVEIANWPRTAVANSTAALEHIDQLLGRVDRNGNPVPEAQWPAWDLIHVNVGLGDLIHRAPKMDSFRVMPIHAGGVVATKPEQYEKNLDELINKLKATGAKVVWASTTPIRASTSNVFRLGSEVKYNAIAERVMKKHAVPINDMYGYVKELIDMDKPAGHGADPFHFDKKPIDAPIIEAIRKALGLPAPNPEPEPVAVKQ